MEAKDLQNHNLQESSGIISVDANGNAKKIDKGDFYVPKPPQVLFSKTSGHSGQTLITLANVDSYNHFIFVLGNWYSPNSVSMLDLIDIKNGNAPAFMINNHSSYHEYIRKENIYFNDKGQLEKIKIVGGNGYGVNRIVGLF